MASDEQKVMDLLIKGGNRAGQTKTFAQELLKAIVGKAVEEEVSSKHESYLLDATAIMRHYGEGGMAIDPAPLLDKRAAEIFLEQVRLMRSHAVALEITKGPNTGKCLMVMADNEKNRGNEEKKGVMEKALNNTNRYFGLDKEGKLVPRSLMPKDNIQSFARKQDEDTFSFTVDDPVKAHTLKKQPFGKWRVFFGRE